MKKIFKLIGIIAIVAIIGFSFAACEEEEDDPIEYASTEDTLNGTTWKASNTDYGMPFDYVLTFSSPNFTMSASTGEATSSINGTYSISGSTVTLTFKNSSGNTVKDTGRLNGNELTLDNMIWTKQ
jgi:hypothetical protein